jgi:predicted nucleic acid-binding protein
MRQVFLDANVIIDWLVNKAINHDICRQTVDLSLAKSRNTFISPTTVAITSYFLYKHYQSEVKAKKMAQQIFEPFRFTTEHHEIVQQALASPFTDLEDAIQYYSAFNAKVDVIVTQNQHDFFHSEIAVITPQEFCSFYRLAGV